MLKEKTPQGGQPIRGNSNHNLRVTEKSVISNIPAAVIEQLEQEIHGVNFGGVSLIVTIRDGHPSFRIEKTISIMTGKDG